MLLEKQSRPGRGRVSSFSKFTLPQVSKLDQNDLLSSVQSVGAKRDTRPPPSTRGFSALPRSPSGSSVQGEEGFSGGYNLVMSQVEERRRLQHLGLATGKKLGEPQLSSVPPSPMEGTVVTKTKKRSSWQPPINGKLQKSRSKSRDGRKGEPPTPTEFMLPHTFSRIHNAPPTPPPESRDRMAKEFVLPHAMASGSEISFSKPHPPFAAAMNSSTPSFARSNASRSSLVSLTPSLDKSVYTLPPLSLGGLADVFTNDDGISSKTGSSISLAKFVPQAVSSGNAVSPISYSSPVLPASPRLPSSPKFTSSPLTMTPSSPACSTPLKRDLGHRKPSPPSAWKGLANDEEEERGRSRYDRTCHRYYGDEVGRRQVLRKMDNLPVSPMAHTTHNSITPSTTASVATSTAPSTIPSVSPSLAPSAAPSLSVSPVASRKASTTSNSSTGSGNVPKRYIRGEDIEKVNPVARPYVEPAQRPQALRIPSSSSFATPPSPARSPQRYSLPTLPRPAPQPVGAAASTESSLPPPPIPPRAPGRASRDSSLTRQTELRQVQTISVLDDASDDEVDEIEEIAPLKPVARPTHQVPHIPSIGDMMKELDDDDSWSVLDGVPERRPTLPRVPSVLPAMHKRHSELPNIASLPVRMMHNDSVSSLQISNGCSSPTADSAPRTPAELTAPIHLPSPLPSPSVPAESREEPSGKVTLEGNERARVSRVLARPAPGLPDQQTIEERRKSTDSSKFKFLKFHHRSKTQPPPAEPVDPNDVTDCMLPPHERSDWKTSLDIPTPQTARMALTRSQNGLPSPALTDSSASSLHPPSKASASSSSTSLTVPDDQARSSKIKVFTICCGCHAWHDLPAKFYTVLYTKVAPVDCIWCNHQMTSSCCEAWTAVANLVERHI